GSAAEAEQRRLPAAAALVTLPATLAHAVDQLDAARFGPLDALGLEARDVDAAARRFVAAVGDEVLVGLDLVLQLAHAQLDHDRIVEEAEHRHRVRDDVLRVGEV